MGPDVSPAVPPGLICDGSQQLKMRLDSSSIWSVHNREHTALVSVKTAFVRVGFTINNIKTKMFDIVGYVSRVMGFENETELDLRRWI